jgi:hypothetical protein
MLKVHILEHLKHRGYFSMPPGGVTSRNANKFYVLPTQCICVFCTYLRKRNYICPTQHYLIVFVTEMEVFTERYELGL